MTVLDGQKAIQSLLLHCGKQWSYAVTSIGDAYAEIFFLDGRYTGLLLLAVTLLAPNVAVSGLIAVFIAFIFAVFIGLKDSFFTSGYFVYNSLLVGFSIGYLYQLSGFVIFIIAASAILTFLLAMMTSRVFYQYLGLPILSIPFTIVSSLIYLASSKFPNLYVNSLSGTSVNSGWLALQSVEHYLIALGSIVFMPNWLAGLLISLIIILRSRIIVFLSVAGYFLGVFITSLLIGSWELALVQPGHFNFILIAVALGSIFTVVSTRSIFLAAIGVALSTLIMGAVNAFWSQYSIPMFTLPFIMVTLSVLYVLRMSTVRWIPDVYKSTPEETLEHQSIISRRCAPSVTINLPFEGEWCVWQGFNGKWTHTGVWKYAYDFVITDSESKTYQGSGYAREDYYCFNKPVLSPVNGKVIAVVNTLPDNPIGIVDSVNNWGNSIIIWDERGVYIEISHFSFDSIAVVVGQWVVIGEHLGQCGNSGYSPEPHIHIQVQSSHWLGADTIPFYFQHYQKKDKYYGFGLPNEGELIEGNPPKQPLVLQTDFLLGEKLKFRVYKNESYLESIEIVVCLESDGTFYFFYEGSKLYFIRDVDQFRCLHLVGRDPYLKAIYMAACFIPFTAHHNASWTDYLQGALLLSSYKHFFMIMAYFCIGRPLGIAIEYNFKSYNCVEGSITTSGSQSDISTELVLDSRLKFKRVCINDLRMDRYE